MKYLISVGHTASGNVGCGAVGYLNESNCTREIVPLIVSKLKSLGHEAIKLQIDNSDSRDYVKRANQANSIGGDMFIEIHLNAGGGSGCEALTTPNSSASNVGYNISKAIANLSSLLSNLSIVSLYSSLSSLLSSLKLSMILFISSLEDLSFCTK